MERRWKAVPGAILEAVRGAMESAAADIVADMNKVKPIPEIEIGWTWGAAPKGSVSVGSFDDNGAEAKGKSLRITIYATASTTEFPGGFAAIAKWFEFGTDPRFTKSGKSTGQIIARPYFYPVWRIWRRRVKGRITRAINKALKSI